MDTLPSVSIIIPCYNEQATIALLLNALDAQTYSHDHIEIVLADGMSTDQTRAEIKQFAASHPDLAIKIVDNEKRVIPCALNRALEASTGEIIVRLDAHSVPVPEYVAHCVSALQAGKADNVGGIWKIKPLNNRWIARAIAEAAGHPLGVGDALYRFTDTAQYVDTVPFGSFYKTLIDHIGPYDESLLANEDYEFNVRIHQNGGKIWLDPAIQATYFARANLRALAKQYWRYGYWKAIMLRRYPDTTRWRQALPPIFVLGLVVLGLGSLFLPWVRWLLALQVGGYLGIMLIAGILSAVKEKDPGLIIGIPAAITTMHVCWGGALLSSLAISYIKR